MVHLCHIVIKADKKFIVATSVEKVIGKKNRNNNVDIYIDGGTRNHNICLVDGKDVIIKQRKSNTTNNDLEYLALLYALGYVRDKYRCQEVTIYSDSQLIVNQMNGKWRVTTPTLTDLHDKCSRMITSRIKIKWVSRKFNLAGHVLEKA